MQEVGEAVQEVCRRWESIITWEGRDGLGRLHRHMAVT